jgi:hypothetical protein
MANKTVAQIKTSLIGLWGYETWGELSTQDQAEVEGYINGALFDCYAPVNGTRPNYGEQYWSEIIKTPVPATLGLTQNSNVVTGFVFEDKYAGSFVKIGERLYRYGKKVVGESTTTYHLVQPWQDATGSYGATVYYNAVELPGLMLETATQYPEILGLGALTPLPDPDQELMMRSTSIIDFRSVDGDLASKPFGGNRLQFNLFSLLLTGEPWFYYIDSASVSQSFGVTNRLHVYPLADRSYTVSLRGQFLPTGDLPSDNTVLPMPFNSVDNILLPIAREKLVMNSAGRRFSGNVQLIMAAAENARKQLRSLTKPQRFDGGGFRTAPGW